LQGATYDIRFAIEVPLPRRLSGPYVGHSGSEKHRH
jgi:hypothetical protein